MRAPGSLLFRQPHRSRASFERTIEPAARFSRKCSSDDVPGISRMLGERCSNHASATCIEVAQRSGHVGERGRLQRRDTAQREERHIGNTLNCKRIDQ